MSKFHLPILYVFREKSCQRALRSNWAGLSQLIFLIVSASHKNVFQLFQIFLKVLQLFECHRKEPIYDCQYELRPFRSLVINQYSASD